MSTKYEIACSTVNDSPMGSATRCHASGIAPAYTAAALKVSTTMLAYLNHASTPRFSRTSVTSTARRRGPARSTSSPPTQASAGDAT